nr:ABC transporter permease [Bacteroidota bacterium]
MFKHFLKITFRNMIQNKFFVIINVVGLGIALACVIVAYSFFKFDYDFDHFHSKRDVIYKISILNENNGNIRAHGVTPASLGPAIKNSLSGIDNVIRYDASTMPVRFWEHIFNERIGFADTDFFEVFDFPMVSGDKNAIRDKKNILISEKMAGVLFGNENPIGKIITVYPADSDADYFFTISGVFKDIPENSSLQYDALTAIDNNFTLNDIQEHSWKDWVDATFLKVSDKERIPLINDQLQRFVEIQNDAREDWHVKSYFTERFKDIPHNENMYNYRLKSSQSIEGALFVGTLAVIILLLACLNFMNTFLAISNRRLKEIGINKVLGGTRRYSILQFLGESIVLCLIALVIGLMFSPFLLDAWNSMVGMDLTIDFMSNIVFWVFLLILLLFAGLVAGAYPAFYISSFNPVKILKGSAKYKAGGWFSKTLLAIQFLLAIIGNVAAVMFIQNATYQDSLYLGYNKDRVIVVPVNKTENLIALKSKLSQNPYIKKIGVADHHIHWNSITQALKCAEEERQVSVLNVGKGYFETMEIQLKDGRYFDQDFRETERGRAVIVNEKLVDDYGWESAIGQRLKLNDTTEYTVIGEMKNFYLRGFDTKIRPTILKLGMAEEMDIIVVDVEIENLKKVNDYIKDVWGQIIPDEPYTGVYQNEKLADELEGHGTIIKIFFFIGIICVLLSMVGLYSLVSLNIIKKTKEIGIRKVLGASMPRLIRIISREFILIVLIGSVLGSVVGSMLTMALLDSIFAYHIDFSMTGLVVPVVSILLITIITIAARVFKAASRNPVESLKYE